MTGPPCVADVQSTDVVQLVEPIGVNHSNVELVDVLVDPELQDLEEVGGGYLSDSDDDSDGDFLFGAILMIRK